MFTEEGQKVLRWLKLIPWICTAIVVLEVIVWCARHIH